MSVKIYYWLKLRKDFFNSRAMKKLRRIAGGATYTIIYLKLLLVSLNDEGKLYSEGVEDDLFDELSLDLDELAEDIKFTLHYLLDCGLAVIQETEIFLPEVPESTGSETDSALRVRNFRSRKKLALQSNGEALHCNSHVTTCNTEKRREDKEKRDSRKTATTKDNKILHSEYQVPMNETRYKNLCEKFGQSTTDSYIEKAVNYIGQTGKPPYACYASAASSYMSRDNVKPEQKPEAIKEENFPDFMRAENYGK
jgi:predicted phage replisome organizer